MSIIDQQKLQVLSCCSWFSFAAFAEPLRPLRSRKPSYSAASTPELHPLA
jgi:hypothetical protein